MVSAGVGIGHADGLRVEIQSKNGRIAQFGCGDRQNP